MGILISQTHAQIGVNSTAGSYSVRTTPASMELERVPVNLNAHTIQPVIEIDQHDAFASAGYKGMVELYRDAADEAYRQVLKYIGRVAEEGDRFANIRTGENVVAALAVEHSSERLDFNVGLLPSAPVHFHAERWRVEFDPDPETDIGSNMNRGLRTEWTPGNIDISYQQGAVKAYMLQKAAVKIRYSGSLEYTWTTLSMYA